MAKQKTLKTNCTICDEVEETRYFDFFVIGSEGVRLCHRCEMMIRDIIEERMMEAQTERLQRMKRARIARDKEADDSVFYDTHGLPGALQSKGAER